MQNVGDVDLLYGECVGYFEGRTAVGSNFILRINAICAEATLAFGIAFARRFSDEQLQFCQYGLNLDPDLSERIITIVGYVLYVRKGRKLDPEIEKLEHRIAEDTITLDELKRRYESYSNKVAEAELLCDKLETEREALEQEQAEQRVHTERLRREAEPIPQMARELENKLSESGEALRVVQAKNQKARETLEAQRRVVENLKKASSSGFCSFL